MVWLTNEEREQNALRDRQAQREGFTSAYERDRHNALEQLRKRLEDVKRRVHAGDIVTLFEARREGLI